MRKLRRNWSLKKSDITRSINRIRGRHSRPSFLTNSSDVVFRDALRRKSAPASVNTTTMAQSGAGGRRTPSFRAPKVLTSASGGGGGGGAPTMFYITLNIEGVGEGEDVLKAAPNQGRNT